VKPRKRIMFSMRTMYLQQTLAATNSDAHVESATVVWASELHMMGVQFKKIVNPDMLNFISPTAKAASV
jgi:hypothetical protein